MGKKQSPHLLIPWYANKTLSERENERVESLIQDEKNTKRGLQFIQTLQNNVQKQPVSLPSEQVRINIIEMTHQERINTRLNWVLEWGGGVVLTVIVLALLWLLIQPGIMLEWGITGSNVSSFRIYRADNRNNFEFIHEVQANPIQSHYSLRDSTLFAAHDYVYLVEGIDKYGQTVTQNTILSQASGIFINQIALLITSVIIAWGTILVLKEGQLFNLQRLNSQMV